jgi:hypothetical protein
VARKYDPLRDYLAARDASDGPLTLSFDQVGQLVGELPPSAASRATWWANSPSTRGQAQAWRDAGWRVQSVDLDAATVIFAPDSVSTAPPSQDPPPEGTSAESVRARLIAGTVAAVSAGVAALASLRHLPWLAIVLLSAGVGAVTFGVSEAITSWGAPAKATRWLAGAMALVLVMAGCAFAYHAWLDPATRPAALPFTISISVNPSTQVMDQGCRQVTLPGPWRNPAPPTALTQDVVNAWEQAQHGVDGGRTVVVIIVQGTSGQAVTISAPQVVISRSQQALSGPVAEFSGGCGAEVPIRQFSVDLDQQAPVARFQDGPQLPDVPAASGTIRQAGSPVFTVSASDAEYFLVQATTARNFVRWYLQLTWQSMGRSGTLPISNAGHPFATSAVKVPGNPQYFLQPAGTWVSAPG